MLIRDNKFDETRQNFKNKHDDACISTSFGQCLETNQCPSVYVCKKSAHVRPPQTAQCIYTLRTSFAHPLHRLIFIDEWAIERPPHITEIFKFQAHKWNINGLKSIKVPKLTRQTLPTTSKRLIESTRSRIIPLNMYENSIRWRSLENEIDLHLLTLNSNAFASHHSASLFKSFWIFRQFRKPSRIGRNSFMLYANNDCTFMPAFKCMKK
jgi:hypothetical protein